MEGYGMTVGRVEFQDPNFRAADRLQELVNAVRCGDGQVVVSSVVSSAVPDGYVVMDPVEQLCSMLAWAEDWSEEYKRDRLEKAIRFVMKESA